MVVWIYNTFYNLRVKIDFTKYIWKSVSDYAQKHSLCKIFFKLDICLQDFIKVQAAFGHLKL